MNEFQPTLFFGFNPEKKGLHQMWVDQYGNHEWRKVPMINMEKTKYPPAIAGTFSEDADGSEDD